MGILVVGLFFLLLRIHAINVADQFHYQPFRRQVPRLAGPFNPPSASTAPQGQLLRRAWHQFHAGSKADLYTELL